MGKRGEEKGGEGRGGKKVKKKRKRNLFGARTINQFLAEAMLQN